MFTAKLFRVVFIFAAASTFAGCHKLDLHDGFPCSAENTCPSPYRCMNKVCSLADASVHGQAGAGGAAAGSGGGGSSAGAGGGSIGAAGDGSTPLPDGSVPPPDGDVPVPDGSIPLPDGGAGTSGDGGTIVVPKVTVSIQLSGDGTVTGGGVACANGTCSVTVDAGSNLVLQANPGATSNFNAWSGCTSTNGMTCSLVGIASSMQLTATFALKSANVIVVKDGSGSGTVSGSWAGGGALDCGASCSAVVPKNTMVTFQGTPSMGSSLSWQPPCSGSGPCAVTAGDTPTTVKATFTLSKVTLTVARTGNGTISGTGGISCADTSCPTQVNYGDSVTLTAAPASDYDFAGWAGCSSTTGTTCVVSSIKAAATATATFTIKKIQVTIHNNGNGSVTSTDGSVNCTSASCIVSVNSGSSLALTATAGSDSDFKSWSGCSTPTVTSSCMLTGITASTAVSATFAIKNASFVISKLGNGTGTVTATWAGGGSLNCGAVCSANIPQGTTVSVQGSADLESMLTFSGACSGSGSCQIVIPAAGTTLNATFKLLQYGLTVRANGSGTVTGPGVNCTTFPCTTMVDSGSSPALTATATGEYTFGGWSGCSSVTGGNVCNVTSLRAATVVTASFVLKQYPVTIQISGNGSVSGSASCAGGTCVPNFDSGSTVTLTANAGSGYDFTSWTGCTTTSGTMCTLSNLKATQMVTATFKLQNATFQIFKLGNAAGSGTVTATWGTTSSLNCGTVCSAMIPLNTVVTLQATASNGSTVLWSPPCGAGGTCQITVMQNSPGATATFTLNRYVLATALGGPMGAGTITSTTSGVNITCPGTCSAPVDYGTSVQLVASAGATGVFSSWSGCTSIGSDLKTCNVTVTSNVTATAAFKLQPGATCASASDCNLSFCVNNVCCGSACNGACDQSCTAGSGVCAHKAAGTQCGSFQGANFGTAPEAYKNVFQMCDGIGQCSSPNVRCGTTGSRCSITNTTACCDSYDGSTLFPVGCRDSSSCYENIYNCNGSSDCPTGQVCCGFNDFVLFKSYCASSCDPGAQQLCDPGSNAECLQGGVTCQNASYNGEYLCE